MNEADDADGSCTPATPATNRSLTFASFSSSPFHLPGISSASPRSTYTERAQLSSAASFTKSHMRSTSRRPFGSSSVSPKGASSTSKNKTVSVHQSEHSACRLTDDVLTTVDGEDAWVCCIAESGGTGKEVGVAMMESGTGRCVLSQFADTQMYGHLLHLLSTHPAGLIILPGPTRLLLPHGAQRSEHDTLRRTLEQNLDVCILCAPRKSFDEEEGEREQTINSQGGDGWSGL